MKTDFLKYILILVISAASAVALSAQDVDSLVFRTIPAVDSTLLGQDVFQIMPRKDNGGKAGVTIHQSQMVEESMRAHVIDNRTRPITGYRIRIFFDNAQDARENSGAAYGTFLKYFRGIPAYRSYVNPYFKVTVGDFRTKAEAMEKLIRIKKVFPTAFVVKEKIRFPYVDRPDLEELPDSVEVFNF